MSERADLYRAMCTTSILSYHQNVWLAIIRDKKDDGEFDNIVTVLQKYTNMTDAQWIVEKRGEKDIDAVFKPQFRDAAKAVYTEAMMMSVC